MILHSIVPTDLLLTQFALQQSLAEPVLPLRSFSLSGFGYSGRIEGRITGSAVTVESFFSTDPRAFLDPRIFPGAQLPLAQLSEE